MKALLLFVLFILTLGSVQTHAKPVVGYKQVGKASYYANKFNGRKTASGERYSHSSMTAAHKYLPMGTRLLVTRKDTKQSVVVRVNDRGPFVKGRIVDLSGKAANKLDLKTVGVANVSIKVLSIPKKVWL